MVDMSLGVYCLREVCMCARISIVKTPRTREMLQVLGLPEQRFEFPTSIRSQVSHDLLFYYNDRNELIVRITKRELCNSAICIVVMAIQQSVFEELLGVASRLDTSLF